MVYIRLAACSCALLILAGCSGGGRSFDKLVPVQGKVTLQDGTPLNDGVLEFLPLDVDALKPPYPTAEIEADGSYKLAIEGKKGAPVGKYRVMFFPGEERKMWSKVSTRYFGRKSPLEVEVTEKPPEGGYDLKLQPRRGGR